MIHKYLVCGGRNFSNLYRSDPLNKYRRLLKTGDDAEKALEEQAFVFEKLDNLLFLRSDILIITGDANGVDKTALAWAMNRGVYSAAYPADWKTYGAAAGPIRNKLMLDKELVDVDTNTGKWKNFTVLAFPGGNGTKDMIKQATKYGVEVVELKYENK